MTSALTMGKRFLFTGKLASMTRSQASAWVIHAGGANASGVTKTLDYLVIGDSGSFLLGAGAKGDKHVIAEALVAAGAPLEIISETKFLQMVGAPAAAAPSPPASTVGPTKVAKVVGGWRGKKFLFTGKLASMTRERARIRVRTIGGVNGGSVSRDLDFLVVGDQGSHLFGGGAKGTKILAAEALIAGGSTLQIISETAFLTMRRGKEPAMARARAGKRKPAAKRRGR